MATPVDVGFDISCPVSRVHAEVDLDLFHVSGSGQCPFDLSMSVAHM